VKHARLLAWVNEVLTVRRLWISALGIAVLGPGSNGVLGKVVVATSSSVPQRLLPHRRPLKGAASATAPSTTPFSFRTRSTNHWRLRNLRSSTLLKRTTLSSGGSAPTHHPSTPTPSFPTARCLRTSRCRQITSWRARASTDAFRTVTRSWNPSWSGSTTRSRAAPQGAL
jgi:hypothetical protein